MVANIKGAGGAVIFVHLPGGINQTSMTSDSNAGPSCAARTAIDPEAKAPPPSPSPLHPTLGSSHTLTHTHRQ